MVSHLYDLLHRDDAADMFQTHRLVGREAVVVGVRTLGRDVSFHKILYTKTLSSLLCYMGSLIPRFPCGPRAWE